MERIIDGETLNVPEHVAIILDGNGRWAKTGGRPRTAGHAAGAESFRTIAYYCKDLGIPYLTVYAFSTENWKRPMEEVSAIMDLLQKYLLEALEKMERDGFRVHFFGDLEGLPPKLRDLCLRTLEEGDALDGTRFQVNVCLNYGGRDEILRAAKAWAADVQAGRQTPEALTDELDLDQYICESVLPWGLAALLIIDDDRDKYNAYWDEFEKGIALARNSLPSEIGEVEDVYGGIEHGEYGAWL